MDICFATNNRNKLREVRQILGDNFRVLSLNDIGCNEELPEEQATLEGNSHQKAAFILDNYNISCFADDTGLEVYALDGEPGVRSARYAGDHRSNEDNINLLLERLQEKENKHAQFRTVITLVTPKLVRQFEGIIKGKITGERRGEEGFGYDSIFIPEGEKRTFAEMSSEEKNAISHRSVAVNKLARYLNAKFKDQ
jgi:XTP/dITP diphosphohydrolase